MQAMARRLRRLPSTRLTAVSLAWQRLYTAATRPTSICSPGQEGCVADLQRRIEIQLASHECLAQQSMPLAGSSQGG